MAETLRTKRQRTIDAVREIAGRTMDEYFEAGGEEPRTKLVDFAQKIQTKYPDHTDFELFHILSSSTPKIKCQKFDFPGEDSIAAFALTLFPEKRKKAA